jgi:hypothetical protein
MAINKAMYNGVQDIMNAYDRNAEVPYYSVWAGRDMVFSYNDDDIEKGRNHLLENLIACEQNEHTDILKIKFHPKKEKTFITDKTPAIATLFVRVCDVNSNRGQIMQMPNNYQNPQLINLIEKQNELISGLHNRISLIEETPEEEEDQETPSEQMIGRIENLLNHPLLNLALGLISTKLPELLKPKNNMVTSLAGVDPVQKEIQNDQLQEIENALERLNNHVDNLGLTLTKLANYADKNTDQFNMLLKML